VDGLVFEVGKAGIGYLLAANHFGGIGGQVASAAVCGGGFGGTAVNADMVFVSCFDGLYAIRVTGGPGGGAPALHVVWSVRGTHPGPPIVAGGDVWTVWSQGELVAVHATTGSIAYRHSLDVAGSFPSPAAAEGMVFAPDQDRVEAFTGV
jgi:outer membrane protein assembly factor BamB